MPLKYNPITGLLELSNKGGGGNDTPPLPAVHLTADDANVATEPENNLRIAGTVGVDTTASGNQLNIAVSGDVALYYKSDDNGLSQPSSSILILAGDTGSGITTTNLGNGTKIQAVNASNTQKGVASFNAAHFAVTTGQVNAKLASTTAVGYASFDSTAFGVDGTGRVTFIKPHTPLSVATDSGTATESSYTVTLHGASGILITASGSMATVTLQPATAAALGGVIPNATAFSITGTGALNLNTVTPAYGGLGLVNPTAGRVPITNGGSNYTLAAPTPGQVIGGSSTGAKALNVSGASGIQVSSDDTGITVKNPWVQLWTNLTATTFTVNNGKNYILKAATAQTLTPGYEPAYSSLSMRLIGAGSQPFTIVPTTYSDAPDTLLINGQTATTQIQAVEPWACCEIVLVDTVGTEIIPGYFVYRSTWKVIPTLGTFTVT